MLSTHNLPRITCLPQRHSFAGGDACSVGWIRKSEVIPGPVERIFRLGRVGSRRTELIPFASECPIERNEFRSTQLISRDFSSRNRTARKRQRDRLFIQCDHLPPQPAIEIDDHRRLEIDRELVAVAIDDVQHERLIGAAQ